MSKFIKKVFSTMLALVIVITTIMVSTPFTVVTEAANKEIYVNPYSKRVVTYKPEGDTRDNYTVISIMGCNKKSEIKNLKSSDKSVTLEKQDGYIVAYYKNKAVKATITCTVKNVKLKTTLTVKKYSNPLKTLKIGSKNYTSKFNKTDEFELKSAVKNQKLSVQLNKGWKITLVSIYNNKSKYYNVDGNKFSKKVSLGKGYSSVYITCENEKTGVEESIVLYTHF